MLILNLYSQNANNYRGIYNMEIQNYLAKPEETIEEHRGKMLRELERMWEYGYIQDRELYELIRIACIHHDDGKANPEMQKRTGQSV